MITDIIPSNIKASDVQCARKEWFRLVSKLAVMLPDDVNYPHWKYAADVINTYSSKHCLFLCFCLNILIL